MQIDEGNSCKSSTAHRGSGANALKMLREHISRTMIFFANLIAVYLSLLHESSYFKASTKKSDANEAKVADKTQCL
jgi:fumarate reductase subunit C